MDCKIDFKDDEPASKPKPEPSVAPQIPSRTQNPGNAPIVSTGIIHQEPTSTLDSALQPNQMESGGQVSGEPRRTANLGSWQTTVGNTCITCLIILIRILIIINSALLALAFIIFIYVIVRTILN